MGFLERLFGLVLCTGFVAGAVAASTVREMNSTASTIKATPMPKATARANNVSSTIKPTTEAASTTSVKKENLYLNVFHGSQTCAFDSGFDLLEVDEVVNGCTAAIQALSSSPTYRFVNVSSTTLYSVKVNCSDSRCTNCELETTPGFVSTFVRAHTLPNSMTLHIFLRTVLVAFTQFSPNMTAHRLDRSEWATVFPWGERTILRM